MRTLYIHTYGCQMNEYDSRQMAAVLQRSHNLITTPQVAEADVILLNSCAIRAKAEDKVFSDLGRWRRLKDSKPELIIGVGGCLASQEGQLLLARAPFIDLIFGPQTIHRLGDLLDEVVTKRSKVTDLSFAAVEKFDNLPEPEVSGPSASLSIMEGCNKYCSFCIVPYTRGPEVSRSVDSILAEVAALAAQGVKEVTLLGQNVNDYAGLTYDGAHADLAFLLEYLAAIPGIARLRFITSHPSAFNNRLIDAFAKVPSIVNHLHLPVQSGSDRILAEMRRGYSVAEYKAKVRKLRQVRPDIAISSDFIIGFPGETDEDFADTVALVQDIGFDHSFSFIYSPRPGTPAALLPDNVEQHEKKRRLQQLQEIIDQQGKAISALMLGNSQEVLVIAQDAITNVCLGRTMNNRIVKFPSNNQELVGKLVLVHITETSRNSLLGVIL